MSPSEFARFLSLCTNLRALNVKSGLLNFDNSALASLRTGLNDATAARPLARVCELSITQERRTHTRCIETLLSGDLLPSLSSLSWTSFDGVGVSEYSTALYGGAKLDPMRHGYGRELSFRHELNTLTIDFRGQGTSLGLLYTLLRPAIEKGTLTSLTLPQLPEPVQLLENAEGPGPVVETMSDLICLLPSSTKLLLGSLSVDPTHSPAYRDSNWPQASESLLPDTVGGRRGCDRDPATKLVADRHKDGNSTRAHKP